MGTKYIAVRVDHDSRPDIFNRFEDYGEPATVSFNSDGSEILKHQGYPSLLHAAASSARRALARSLSTAR
jgi:hypothetical protein